MELRKLLTDLDRDLVEAHFRKQTKYAYLGERLGLAQVLGDYKMFVDTRDASITPHLIMDGYWESWVTQALARRVETGWRCADIGANIGYYTVLLGALAGTSGFVRAYEPIRSLTELLTRTIALNGISGQVSWCAISNCDREAWLEFSSYNQCVTRLIDESDGHCHRVSLRPLSAEHDGMFDFVKVDVEHHEVPVMESVHALGEQTGRQPQVMLEYDFRDSNAKEFDGWLHERYTLEVIGPDGQFRAAPELVGLGPTWLWLVPR